MRVKTVVIVVAAVILGGVVYMFWFGPQNQATAPETSGEAVTELTPEAQATQAVDDATQAAIMAALVEKHGWDMEEIDVMIHQRKGMYASGLVREVGVPAGAGVFFAANVDGAWEIVWDGNGSVLCEDLENYPEYPDEMIPECYDQATNTVVTRE